MTKTIQTYQCEYDGQIDKTEVKFGKHIQDLTYICLTNYQK